MTSDYIARQEFEHILAALMPPNRLAVRVSLSTGLRIGDVLSIKTAKLAQRMTVRESKTGKNHRVRFPKELYEEMTANAGKYYVFEHRTNEEKHRTRSAVYKDIKRAAELFRLSNLQVSPHTARKIYAVDKYKESGSIAKVKELLQHSNEAVTILYAMSDQLTERRLHAKKKL